jgi:Tfp pilus assembly protein PilF
MTWTQATVKRGLWVLLAVSLIIGPKAYAYDTRVSYALSHYIMGTIDSRLGNLDDAIEEYRQALNADKRNPFIRLNLAANFIKKNQLDKAAEELKLASRYDPEAVEPHAILALLYSSQNKPEEAAAEYEAALKQSSKLEPNNIEIYKTLGALYLQQKKFSEAVKTYELVLKSAPKDAEAHFYLANIYDEMKNRAKAEAELQEAVRLKPDYHEALNYLGYCYADEGKNLDQAEAMIKTALEMEPENGAYVDSLGWVYFKRGDPSRALELLKKAAALMEDPVIFDHLGDVYSALKDKENAKGAWEKSLQLDKNQDSVKKKLEGLK